MPVGFQLCGIPPAVRDVAGHYLTTFLSERAFSLNPGGFTTTFLVLGSLVGILAASGSGPWVTTMLIPAPFPLPPGFLAAFGYRGGRRFVALYWEPCGDESCYCDGVSTACGLTDNWLYLDFVRQSHVLRWREEHVLDLGSSDGEAKHWLVVDSSMG